MRDKPALPMSELNGRQRPSSLSFLIRFAALLAVFNLYSLFPNSLGRWAADLTVRAVSGFSKLLGVPVSSSGIVMNLWGFNMIVTVECTAIQYLTIFLAAVLGYPGRSAKSRVVGILAGTVIILLFNIVRIVGIGYIGAKAPDVFDFVHTYLWQGMFVVFVFVLWLQWVNGFGVFRLELLGRIAAALSASAAAILLLGLFMPYYMRFLASIADALFALLPLGKTISASAKGEVVLYAYDGLVSYYPLELDIYYSASFFAVIAFLMPGIRRRSLYALPLYPAMLVCLHIIYIAAGFFFADYFLKKQEVHYLMWHMRLVSIVAPVLLGLWAGGLTPRRKD